MLKETWNKWKTISQKIGDVQANFIFSILYYLLIVPVGFVTSLFKDYLDIKESPKWNKLTDDSSTLAKLKEQY